MAFGRHGRAREEPALDDPANLVGTFQEMAYAMREQVVVADQMMEQIGRQLEESYEGNPNGTKVDFEYLKFTKFKKANPPK